MHTIGIFSSGHDCEVDSTNLLLDCLFNATSNSFFKSYFKSFKTGLTVFINCFLYSVMLTCLTSSVNFIEAYHAI